MFAICLKLLFVMEYLFHDLKMTKCERAVNDQFNKTKSRVGAMIL